MLIQTCQIISGPAPTEQQTKGQARYKHKKYTMNLVIFSGIVCFDGTNCLHVKEGSQQYQVPHQKSSICTPGTSEGGARKATKATNNSSPGHG